MRYHVTNLFFQIPSPISVSLFDFPYEEDLLPHLNGESIVSMYLLFNCQLHFLPLFNLLYVNLDSLFSFPWAIGQLSMMVNGICNCFPDFTVTHRNYTRIIKVSYVLCVITHIYHKLDSVTDVIAILPYTVFWSQLHIARQWTLAYTHRTY